MRSIWGIVTAALVVLVTIYAYNKFSGKNIAALGAKAAA
jgi:hypothetical protein